MTWALPACSRSTRTLCAIAPRSTTASARTPGVRDIGATTTGAIVPEAETVPRGCNYQCRYSRNASLVAVSRWKALMREVLGLVVPAGLEFVQRGQRGPGVVVQGPGQVGGEAFADHDAQHGYVVGVVGHRVGGHLPAVPPQFVREVELGVPAVPGQPEAHYRDRRAVRDQLAVVADAQLLAQPPRGRGQRVHDLGVALAAQPQEVVVLADHLVARTGEVQREGRHVAAQV